MRFGARRDSIDDVACRLVRRLASQIRITIRMTEHSLWRLSHALHRAINERHFDPLAELIDDDIDWAIYGPIDMFPFLGDRKSVV